MSRSRTSAALAAGVVLAALAPASPAVAAPVLPGPASGTGVLPTADASPSAAAARSWRVESFRTDLHVRPDGWVEVRERLRVRFQGQFRGIYRTVPVDYQTPAGFGYRLDVERVRVTDGDGRELRVEQSKEGRHRKLKIWVPGATDTVREVRIAYRVYGAIRFDEEHEELYWNATGTQWPVPIGEARATVYLPDEATGIRAVAYVGPHGSSEKAGRVEVEGSTVRAAAGRDLDVREGLTVAALWDAGAVARPSLLVRARRFLAANWPFAAVLAVLGMMGAWWYTRGRDPDPGTVTVRYEPPDGMTPAEAGVLVDYKADPRDLSATIVDLAVRGYVTILEEGGALFEGDEVDRTYVFRLERDREEWGDELAPHERELLEGLFPDGEAGTEVDTSMLRNEFYKKLDGIKDALFEGPLSGMLREGTRAARSTYLTVAAAVVACTVAFSPHMAFILDATYLSLLLSGALVAAIIAGFGWFMPARTRAGARRLGQALGFEEFLRRVEEDRFQRMIAGPETFERYLPYAMAFGVENEWAQGFTDLVREPPEWYVGAADGRFTPSRLTTDLGRMSDRTGSAMTSKPRSAGSSGGLSSSFSGGGGFSGGGFGGGGGGAF